MPLAEPSAIPARVMHACAREGHQGIISGAPNPLEAACDAKCERCYLLMQPAEIAPDSLDCCCSLSNALDRHHGGDSQ